MAKLQKIMWFLVGLLAMSAGMPTTENPDFNEVQMGDYELGSALSVVTESLVNGSVIEEKSLDGINQYDDQYGSLETEIVFVDRCQQKLCVNFGVWLWRATIVHVFYDFFEDENITYSISTANSTFGIDNTTTVFTGGYINKTENFNSSISSIPASSTEIQDDNSTAPIESTSIATEIIANEITSIIPISTKSHKVMKVKCYMIVVSPDESGNYSRVGKACKIIEYTENSISLTVECRFLPCELHKFEATTDLSNSTQLKSKIDQYFAYDNVTYVSNYVTKLNGIKKILKNLTLTNDLFETKTLNGNITISDFSRISMHPNLTRIYPKCTTQSSCWQTLLYAGKVFLYSFAVLLLLLSIFHFIFECVYPEIPVVVPE